MKTLELTDKEAIAFHMIYQLGGFLVAGEPMVHVINYLQIVCNFIAAHISEEERIALKAKISELGNIDKEYLKTLNVQNTEQEMYDHLNRTN